MPTYTVHDEVRYLRRQLRLSNRRITNLEQREAILLQLIDRGFMDVPGMDTAAEEMIELGIVPAGWSIGDVKPSA